MQPTAAPHWPLASHVSTPAGPPSVVAHCFEPGTQTPWHIAPASPATQAELTHAVAEPHCPPEHDCTALPEHCVEPAVQEPVHCPPAHIPAAHAFEAPHCPFALHVSTPLPVLEHCFVAGAHTPVHAPKTQAWLPQSAGADH